MLDHNKYPVTTLFMLISIDGKISTGEGSSFDVDKDYPTISGLKEGLPSYYAIQGETDWWCINTGKTMAKIGVNSGAVKMANVPGLHRVIYGVRSLNTTGIKCLASQSDYIHFIVRNKGDMTKVQKVMKYYPNDHWTVRMFDGHPNHDYYNPFDVLAYLKSIGCDALTVQNGGTVNGTWAEKHAFDKLHLVMAPCLIGGSTTPTLVDGNPRTSGLSHINTFKLVRVQALPNSYIELEYET